jgi:F-type H+-transporting ATPase subunit epsilon
MRLRIISPSSIVLDLADVVSVRAEDETGSFGILDRHTDFLTVLTVSVIGWRHADGRPGYCAARRGILSVRAGTEVEVATSEAVLGNNLELLEQTVLTRFRHNLDVERAARTESLQLEARAIRRIMKYLRPDSATMSA